MAKQTRSTTGIPKIDAEVKVLENLPQCDTSPITTLRDDFPGCDITKNNSRAVTIHVVGAGWNLPLHATAIAAAGANMIAYDMNKDKIGRGQMG